MRMKTVRACVLFVAALALAATAIAQEGHPTTGTWYGDYTSGTQKTDLTVVMKWDGKSISGLINPGPNSKPITGAVMDITPGKPAEQGRGSTTGTPPIFHVRFEADGMTFEGTIKNPVAVNRQLIGTWSRGAQKGTFQIRRL
jgi:hypothetical protein